MIIKRITGDDIAAVSRIYLKAFEYPDLMIKCLEGFTKKIHGMTSKAE
jgi:hypothetical protein